MNMVKSGARLPKVIKAQCSNDLWDSIWLVSDIFILITGVVSNAALLWLFLKDRKSLSASQVLGLNLVAMNLIFLSIIPVNLVYEATEQVQRPNLSDFSAIAWRGSTSTHSVDLAREIFSMFNLIGCPLLLSCMCVERYLAVTKPVLYLRLRKWEYRMAVSAVVWFVTSCFCLATGLVPDITIIMIPVSAIISCLFILMLICLSGVVSSLQQQSPAHSTSANHARSESPLKRRAVGNVLAVVVPAVVAYLPVLLMVPLVLYMYYISVSVGEVMCNAFELSTLFPRFGVLIGPLFYLSKARQMWCLGGKGKKCNE